jgi:SAM-dependent methyltransferase
MIKRNDDFTKTLLRAAKIDGDVRVLDVGCGAGDVALMAARMLGGQGTVVGVDIDQAALNIARRMAEENNYSNVTFQLADIGALPNRTGVFDVIVGRRVLMYQPDAARSIKGLLPHLKKGGRMAFQEHDATLTPASPIPMPLHARAQSWIWDAVKKEGGDIHLGFNLYSVFAQAGLTVEWVKAELAVQTPSQNTELGDIVQAMLPRILKSGVATEAEIDIGTLIARLDTERQETNTIFLRDLMIGVVAQLI